MKLGVLTAISGLLMVSTVHAQTYLFPPSEYDHQPTIPVEDHLLRTLSEVLAYCMPRLARGYASDFPMAGCSTILKGKCIIHRINNYYVWAHERAHCNGWKHPIPPHWQAEYKALQKNAEQITERLKAEPKCVWVRMKAFVPRCLPPDMAKNYDRMTW
jgi:hypothetical protein